MSTIRSLSVGAALATFALSGAAMAQGTVGTFTYNSLSGNYTQSSPTAGAFSAFAVDTPTLRTDGSFERQVPTTGVAQFVPGFVSAANPADIVLNLSVFNVTSTSADSTGTIAITDVNGTVFNASISGSWTIVPGAIVFSTFSGSINTPSFTGPTFTGNTGSFATDLPGPLSGAIVTLTFSGVSFLGGSFSDATTNVAGQLVPTPGAVALLGLGGLLAARRRRN